MKFLKVAIFPLFQMLFVGVASSNEVEFNCYDILSKKSGHYELTGGIKFYPTNLKFDASAKTVTKATGSPWRCSVISWGDPLIYFGCTLFNRNNNLVVSVDLFDRNTSRYATESISVSDLETIYKEAEIGTKGVAPRNERYEQCVKKGF